MHARQDIPQRPGPGPAPFVYLTILSAMFMHGGFGHIAGNMLYLWIFGDNVEHRFGTARFVLFYLVSGIVATLVQVAMHAVRSRPQPRRERRHRGRARGLPRAVSAQSR